MNTDKREWTAARRRQLLAICAAWAMLTLGCLTATHALEVVQRDDGAGNVTVGGKILVEYAIREPLHEYLQKQEGSSNPDGTEVGEGWTIEQAEQGRIFRFSREFATAQEFVATVPAMETLMGGDEDSEDLITGLEVVSRTLEAGGMEFEMALTLYIPPPEDDETVGESFFGVEDDPELLAALEASGDPSIVVSMTMPGLIIEATDNDEPSGDQSGDNVASWVFGADAVGEHVLRVVSVTEPGADTDADTETDTETGAETDTDIDAEMTEAEAAAALAELVGMPTTDLLDPLTVVKTVTPYANAESAERAQTLMKTAQEKSKERRLADRSPELEAAIQGATYLIDLRDGQGKPLFPALRAWQKVLVKMWKATKMLEGGELDESAVLAALRFQSILIRQDLAKLAAKQAAVP